MHRAIVWTYAVTEAVLLLVIELFVRGVFYLFPFLPRLSNLFWRVFSPRDVHPEASMDAGETIESRGYPFEAHIVTTRDGYLLTLHRIPHGVVAGQTSVGESKRPAVFIQHGFMNSSEAWLAPPAKESLPFVLADAGFDVWLGNNRGNKYSCRHETLSEEDDKFWDFCIDDYARFDIPACIDYVCKHTQQEQIAYIGFSQGTAQMFAALSTNQEMARKISIFIATAPCTLVQSSRLKGLTDVLTHTRPELIHLFFGRKAALSAWIHWRRALNPRHHVHVIDLCCFLLFGWKLDQISFERKVFLYAKIYSMASVKNVIHWFQIAQSHRFQMMDNRFSKTSNDGSYKLRSVPRYDLSRIRVPIAMFYGGRDDLPDTSSTIRELNSVVYLQCEEDYEHLDFMWADSAPKRVFPKIVHLLRDHIAPPPSR